MSSYQPLFQISLLHDYYEGSSCPDLSMRPTPACEKLLTGQQMPVKASVGGVRVKTAVVDDETDPEKSPKPFLPLSAGAKLTFFLDLKNPCFTNFTDLTEPSDDEPSAGEMYLFRYIPDQETFTRSKISRAQAGADHTPFALVEIQVTEELFPTPIQEKKFVIQFKAVERSWKYYLIVPNSTKDNDYTIEGSTTNGTEAIIFQKFDEVESPLPNEVEVTKRVTKALREAFPNQTYLFISTKPAKVPARAIGRKNIQLKRGENTLIQHLPNPATSDQGIKILKL